MSLPTELEWDFDLPVFDRFIAQNMLKVLIVAALVLVPVFYLSPFVCTLIGACVLVTALIRFMIQQSYRQVRFRVESRGAGFTTRSKQRDVYKKLGSLLVLMGIAKSSLTAITIGLQQSQTEGAGVGKEIAWNEVRNVSLYPKQDVVLLKERWFTGGLGGGLMSIRLYCTPENYETVAAMSLKQSRKRRD
jgi:hypothetical protein